MLKLGIIGTDTSHCIAFTRLLTDQTDPNYITGAEVVAAFPGGSPDFPLSINRVENFMTQLEEEFAVRRCGSIKELAEQCSAILLLSADGRVHAEQLSEVLQYRKPVFVDKPFALSKDEANRMFAEAEEAGVPVMSSSSLRYTKPLANYLAEQDCSDATGVIASGPLMIEETQSRYYWYGIHSVEMLYAVMGPGCLEVTTTAEDHEEIITGRWSDNRLGTVRLIKIGDPPFEVTVYRGKEVDAVAGQSTEVPFYASLLQQVIGFFTSGTPAVSSAETVEIISFIEAAEKSLRTGVAEKL